MPITSAQLLSLLRRKVSDTDVTASFTDEQLWQYIEDARLLLSVKQVSGMSGLTVDTDPNSASFGIAPDPADDVGFILVLRAAMDILQERYRDLVEAGALGVSWRSGLEEESSIQADKAFKAALDDLRKELDALILIQNRASSATRPL